MDKQQQIKQKIAAAEKELAELKILLEKQNLAVGQKFAHSLESKWIISQDNDGQYGLICYESSRFPSDLGLSYCGFHKSIEEVFYPFPERFTRIQ